MNPAVMIFLLIALLGGCVKLVVPRAFPPWEFVFLLLGAAAVLALDAIRDALAAIAEAKQGGPMMASPFGGGGRLQVGPASSVPPVSSQKSGQISQKSEKSGGASSIGP